MYYNRTHGNGRTRITTQPYQAMARRNRRIKTGRGQKIATNVMKRVIAGIMTREYRKKSG